MYSWGTWGDFPGGMWGVHGMSVDQDGNFYVAEVDNGGAQKYAARRREPGVPGRQAGPGRVEMSARVQLASLTDRVTCATFLPELA